MQDNNLDGFTQYEDLLKLSGELYKSRVQLQEKLLDNIWKEHNDIVKNLNSIVKEEFKNVLKEVPLVFMQDRAEITDFDVEYFPQFSYFKIKIKKLETKFGDDAIDFCPHGYLEKITGFDKDPRIKEFMKKYNVEYISNPYNNCEHK
ncbi:MAG: hypothetical protein ACP5OG_02850 [Candidatus Nanoarchaeia archaeon]